MGHHAKPSAHFSSNCPSPDAAGDFLRYRNGTDPIYSEPDSQPWKGSMLCLK